MGENWVRFAKPVFVANFKLPINIFLPQAVLGKASDNYAAGSEMGFVLAKTSRLFTPPIVTLATTADAS